MTNSRKDIPSTITTVAVIVVLLVIVGGIFLTQRNRSNCENDAARASIEMYPVSEYPDTGERSRLQDTYKQTYMESCQ